jgi:hypothetical protein
MAHAWVNVTNITDEDYKERAVTHKTGQSMPEMMHSH